MLKPLSAKKLLHEVDIKTAKELAAAFSARTQRGMLNSEILLVYYIIKTLGICRVVESGRYLGHSTKTLADLLCETSIRIESIDLPKEVSKECERRLSGYKNVKVLYGDSFSDLPNLVDCQKVSTILLVDGPKGPPALDLISRCFERSGHLVAAFLHDCFWGSEARQAVEKKCDNVAFTDDPIYVERFAWLDKQDNVTSIQPDKYHGAWESSLNHQVHKTGPLSYGPTLALIIPKKETRSTQ